MANLEMAGLTELKSMVIPPTTVAQLAQRYPQFKHVPFDESGINPLVLPFHYSDTTGAGASEEALAFSFLLSEDLDWASENYTTRHAYFIYKRQSAACKVLAQSYEDSKLIAALLRKWTATHGVGGEICRQPEGYTGTLRIFNPAGTEIHSDNFKTPRAFHELLGDMDIAAMKAMGCKPREEFVAHLHLPRCKNPTSLVLLGKAAFAPERAGAEFDIYKKILEQDPEFSEVRYWYANQNWWHTHDRSACEEQIALSLNSRVNLRVLVDFHSSQCLDKALAAKFPQWLAEAEKIAGADSPSILQIRLNAASAEGKPALELLEAATKVAAANPNQGFLVQALGFAYGRPAGFYDLEMAISLYLAKMQSRFIPAIDFSGEAKLAAEEFLTLGRPREALEVLATIEGPGLSSLGTRFSALAQAGDFDAILDWYRAQQPAGGVLNNTLIARSVAVAVCARDDAELLRKLLDDNGPLFASDKLTGVLNNCLAELDGTDFEVNPNQAWYQGQDGAQYHIAVALQADRDLRHGRGRFRTRLEEMLRTDPLDRLAWVLMDQYHRLDPKPVAWRFYSTLEFLYPDDPWVVEALTRWRKLQIPLAPEKRAESLALMKNVPATERLVFNGKVSDLWKVVSAASPWDVAARVHELQKSGRKTEAVELARKYRQVSAQTMAYSLSSFTQQLVRRTEQP